MNLADTAARRPEISMTTAQTPPITITQARNMLNVDPDVSTRKSRRAVSFRLPGEASPSPSNEAQRQAGKGKESSSSNKENSILKNASAYTHRPADEEAIDEQNFASARRVSLIHNNEAPFKSPHCPPTMSAAAPKDFKVRDARGRRSENDAVQSLKLAVQKDDVINDGSPPQGMFPTLRRIVNGITEGLQGSTSSKVRRSAGL